MWQRYATLFVSNLAAGSAQFSYASTTSTHSATLPSAVLKACRAGRAGKLSTNALRTGIESHLKPSGQARNFE